MPLRSIVRLWDSYFAEPGPDERSTLHLFTCSAFLIHWKRLLLEQCDFQGEWSTLGLKFNSRFSGLMLAVQGLPTSGWGDSEIAELLAKAFMLRSTYTVKDVEAGHWKNNDDEHQRFLYTTTFNSPLTTWENWRIMYRSDVQFKPNLVSFFCYEFCQACVFFKSRYPRLYYNQTKKQHHYNMGCSLININSSRA